ncbi:MAG TPA: tRNA (adenosine(37)-N6)-threonylcarbamoyltransferase complex ATPase subunit type 1 TsaE [Candidatus Hydrogenedentes bacterium]|nr:tRNA (adenosine(37)-N6)-threonylcarbamoyltransferase complex ATPase subunit type 1 TsaE [Candidatus Hydrogenedentota bacterium]
MNTLALETHAPEETERLGHVLMQLLPQGSVVALFGDLATGKTCFVRGMAARFSGEHPVHSPTFTLVNEYGHSNKLYHLDLYRLSGPEELLDLDYEDFFDSDGICVIEWAERAGALLPKRCVHIEFEHGGGDTRKITITNSGVLSEHWPERLQQGMGTRTA